MGTRPAPSSNSRPTKLGADGNGVFQGSLLVGADDYPAAAGASAGDAFFVGHAWFYDQLVIANKAATNTTPNWSIAHVNAPAPGDEAMHGALRIFPGWQPSKQTVFGANGDVSFSSKVRIGATGSSTNNCLLAVDGKIGSRGGVHVIGVGGAWPDYVFAPAYSLKPLVEVEAFIHANHHLPETPSAAEVQDKGIELVEMQALLLKKVEELTLYLIALEKRNAALQERIQKLEH